MVCNVCIVDNTPLGKSKVTSKSSFKGDVGPDICDIVGYLEGSLGFEGFPMSLQYGPYLLKMKMVS